MKYHEGTWLPEGDTFFQTRGDYENRDYQRLIPYVQNRRVAIDIGAHVGYWSKRLIQDFEIVYAFEPEKEHVECLRLNVNNHRLIINEIGLSDKSEVLKFEKSIENSGMSRISSTGKDLVCVPLDQFQIINVDFMKIDVEGHELSVLLGAKETISKFKPVLFIEILHGLDTTIRTQLFDFIAKFNYNMVDIVDENYIFVNIN